MMKLFGINKLPHLSHLPSLLVVAPLLLVLPSQLQAWPTHFFRGSRIGYGREIRPFDCEGSPGEGGTGEGGTCMFALDCMKSRGSFLGHCIDGFYFGACCRIDSPPTTATATASTITTTPPPLPVDDVNNEIPITESKPTDDTSESGDTEGLGDIPIVSESEISSDISELDSPQSTPDLEVGSESVSESDITAGIIEVESSNIPSESEGSDAISYPDSTSDLEVGPESASESGITAGIVEVGSSNIPSESEGSDTISYLDSTSDLEVGPESASESGITAGIVEVESSNIPSESEGSDAISYPDSTSDLEAGPESASESNITAGIVELESSNIPLEFEGSDTISYPDSTSDLEAGPESASESDIIAGIVEVESSNIPSESEGSDAIPYPDSTSDLEAGPESASESNITAGIVEVESSNIPSESEGSDAVSYPDSTSDLEVGPESASESDITAGIVEVESSESGGGSQSTSDYETSLDTAELGGLSETVPDVSDPELPTLPETPTDVEIQPEDSDMFEPFGIELVTMKAVNDSSVLDLPDYHEIIFNEEAPGNAQTDSSHIKIPSSTSSNDAVLETGPAPTATETLPVEQSLPDDNAYENEVVPPRVDGSGNEDIVSVLVEAPQSDGSTGDESPHIDGVIPEEQEIITSGEGMIDEGTSSGIPDRVDVEYQPDGDSTDKPETEKIPGVSDGHTPNDLSDPASSHVVPVNRTEGDYESEVQVITEDTVEENTAEPTEKPKPESEIETTSAVAQTEIEIGKPEMEISTEISEVTEETLFESENDDIPLTTEPSVSEETTPKQSEEDEVIIITTPSSISESPESSTIDDAQISTTSPSEVSTIESTPKPDVTSPITITTTITINATTLSPAEQEEELVQMLANATYKDVCGSPVYPNKRIVGGSEASYGEWPWQVSLRQWRSVAFLHKCGSALVNENWAITAAHCVEGIEPDQLLLVMGEYNLGTTNEPYGHVERNVQVIAMHPKFEPRTFEFDLALLRFSEPLTFQPNIIPICIPGDDYDFLGDTGYVTGWGRLYEDGPLPTTMQKVPVPVIPNKECESMYKEAGYIEHIPHIFICAGYQSGKQDSCEGDSGGPMVIRYKNRWRLAGIISWGIGCAVPNQPGVYTRISEFREWINKIIIF